jgi:hypothetical protein
MLKRQEETDDKVVTLRDRRKPRTKMNEDAAHENFIVPVVKDLICEGFSAGEIAEMLRVAADVLDGKNEDLY